MHAARKQARARASTWVVVCWAPSTAAADAAAVAAAATQERLRKCGGRQGGDKGITISRSPREPIVSSSRRSATARNPAQSLRCPQGRPSEGGVLSRGRPCPKAGPAGVSATTKERCGRKMLTSLSPRPERGSHIAYRCLNRGPSFPAACKKRESAWQKMPPLGHS